MAAKFYQTTTEHQTGYDAQVIDPRERAGYTSDSHSSWWGFELSNRT